LRKNKRFIQTKKRGEHDEKVNVKKISTVLSREEMKEIMAGSDWLGGGGGCSGNWTIEPACSGYDGSNPNAIVCFEPGKYYPTTVCNPAPGTNPQTACCG
jgi:hypothetical protein